MRCITGGPSAACYAADDVSAGGGCFLVCAGDRPSSGCRHLTGVEPLVSTRPSDPRKRGEGTMPRPLDSLFSPRGEGARRADEGAGDASLSNNTT
ncbi:hypothetical protein GFL93_17215 [Rhizobium leguminosarum bv. viciae]|uniref:Uncharacterized protein n=1 Tax=Rhizobium leguminosarum bv. viciae TaxID=387 RepID=A0A8G2MR34_RHILV|nr:hypothetical protein [Rhizobium leguminosarum bv. viciae]TBX92516.1 hypothetical protein E0H31_17655 [Rhizobium leguminosarum bv. viciae]